jgi:hypothetical protein
MCWRFTMVFSETEYGRLCESAVQDLPLPFKCSEAIQVSPLLMQFSQGSSSLHYYLARLDEDVMMGSLRRPSLGRKFVEPTFTRRLLQFSHPLLDLLCTRRFLETLRARALGISESVCSVSVVLHRTKVWVKSVSVGVCLSVLASKTWNDDMGCC